MFPRNILLTSILTGLLLFCGCTSNSSLEWKKEDGYRWAEVSSGYWGGPGFSAINPSTSNINFENHLTEEEIIENRHLLNGSGVATGDVDGDGLADIYFANLNGTNKLYKNTGGFAFKDITAEAGVAHPEHYSTGVVLADVDGDSDADLLVASLSKGVTLYKNDGTGTFTPEKNAGFESTKGKGTTTLALADVDNDRDLDLYVTNYKERSVKDMYGLDELAWDKITRKTEQSFELIFPFDRHYKIFRGGGEPDRREFGEMDQLFLNEGDGTFQQADGKKHFLDQKGNALGLRRDWGLTAKFQDINGDKRPDLYVCNDFWTPDRIWINRGNGIFKEIEKKALRNLSFSSMAVDFSDINRDGSLDFFVTEMMSAEHQTRMRHLVTYPPAPSEEQEFDALPQYMRNTLFLNRGDQTFAEIAHFSNTAATGWSWATRFMDIDLDGYEDLLITTGNAYDVQDLDTQEQLNQKNYKSKQAMKGYILEYPPLNLTNVALKNNQDLTFSNQGNRWGFTEKDVSHGLATADFDHDGDLDLVTNRLNNHAQIFENKVTAPRIAVRLNGKKPNTQAIGAKVKLMGGNLTQQKEIVSGGDYVSGSDPVVAFAAGTTGDSTLRLDITWPDGKHQTISGIKANVIYEINESGTSSSPPNEDIKKTSPIFKDISERISFTHYDQEFNDFRLQPLLPMQLSRLGPGVAWIDFDADGDDDLFITTGKGGQPGIFENTGNGTFTPIQREELTLTAPGDQTAILGWNTQSGASIVVGSSNYEQGNASSPSAFHYQITKNGTVKKSELPGILSSTGALAASDYDNDGDVDLFMGGRFKPVQYPEDATSRLFTNENGTFQLDTRNVNQLKQVGLVTAAVFSDYDQDGDPDLFLSREWDSIKLYENNNGVYHDVTDETGLDAFEGRWNGITTGDFNNDGRPDLVASNWGLNSEYQTTGEHPLRLFYDDFDRDSKIEIMDTYYNNQIQGYVPRQRLYQLYEPIPTLVRNVTSHRNFAQSSLDDMLQINPENTPSKKVNTLAHTVFINQRDGFQPHPLPDEAQFSTAFHVGVFDYNNDGNEDLFLSQNFFALPKLLSRQNGGRGLLLRGDGTGEFHVIPGHQSGIKVYGEQRGAAFSDFDSDGKTDIAVSQNSDSLKIYRNQHGKSGISLQLMGPADNKNGIGAAIRLIFEDDRKGPRREIRAGSGYWSQNSFTQVMGYTKKPAAIEITWPDGTLQKVDIQARKKFYTIHYPN